MNGVALHLRVIAQMARTSLQVQAQYRLDFFLQLVLAGFWVFWNVVPVWIVFDIRPTISDWSRAQAMLVMAGFLILKALLDGLIQPNLASLVQHIRYGTLDFILLKPADSQVLASLSKLAPAKLVDLSAGVAIAAWAVGNISPLPSAGQIAAGAFMLLAGAITIYGIWMMIICSAFFFIKMDNLSYLFTSIFDAARWPISVFRGWARVLLTFVVPVAVMTSYPAMAIMGRLELRTALAAWLTSLLVLGLSRVAWLWSVRHYASASS